jgi:hypothetical protein
MVMRETLGAQYKFMCTAEIKLLKWGEKCTWKSNKRKENVLDEQKMCINQNLIPQAHLDVAHEQGQTSKINDKV